MTSNKNIPDRIKLILQFIVFSIALWLFVGVSFMILSDKMPAELKPGPVAFTWLTIGFSVGIQFLRLIYQWKKLLNQEKTGTVPDQNEIGNLDTFQSFFLLPGILLLVVGVIVFNVYSKPWGILCFIFFGILWIVDSRYFKNKKALHHKRTPG
jgi:phosphatidylglycerophosphate synthase